MANGLKIKHALYLEGWSFETGVINDLYEKGSKIIPEEYVNHMQGRIYCPLCRTNLSKSPQDKAVSKSSMVEHFRHQKKYKSIECKLRSGKTIGKKYINEEEVKSAIDNQDLVIVGGFMVGVPENPEVEPQDFDGEFVEQKDGPEVGVPIGRHSGEKFEVPSKIQTLRGILRDFDRNLERYFFFPNFKNPIKLSESLSNILYVEEEEEEEKLYYGKIINSFYPAEEPQDHHLLMLQVECSERVKDFYVKLTKEFADHHGLNEDSNNRYILVYGSVVESGIGLAIDRPNFGEIAVIPKKYENYLA